MIKRIREIEQCLDRENPRVIGVAAAEDQDIMELVKVMPQDKHMAAQRSSLEKSNS